MKTVNSFIWSSIEKIGQAAIQIIITIVLANLLSVEDFGRIGFLTVFILISNTIIDGGFSQALIRLKKIAPIDLSSVFWLNIIVSASLYLVLFLLTPLICSIINDSELILMSRVLFIVVVINSFNVVQLTLINKYLQFKKIALYTVLSALISGVIGVIMALNGFGVWALICQTLFYALFFTLFLWLRSTWRPDFTMSWNVIKKLAPFSLQVFSATFLNVLFNNLYTFVIGKFFSPKKLGYYSQANRFATQPANLFDAIFNRMTYPILSTMQDDLEKYKKKYLLFTFFITVITVPIMTWLVIIAPQFVGVFLGVKWMPIVPIFQLLCVAGLTFPLHPLYMSTLKVFGNSKLILHLEFVKKIIQVIIILFTLPQGMNALVLGQLLYYVVVLFINMYFSGKEIRMNLLYQIKEIYPAFLLSLICACITLVMIPIGYKDLTIMIIKTISFLSLYSLMGLFLFRNRLYILKEEL